MQLSGVLAQVITFVAFFQTYKHTSQFLNMTRFLDYLSERDL